ncbi:ATPase domain-containing protein [Luteimonas sp. MC1572]|uniref:ATPase domain-containing protein n=1 Tax=Luteimonas sp. MC1572 TaxID=2799325 RepID=UPI0018F074B9|nr:ATPase domain-containing protein [Luteimonas sp. MC1572]MBJ6982754.1 AAA family ATPase [Luteimonas sp. MC1572]QQO03990.1 AAA family ATPase [Luteimonas sp. MC1572]
MPKPEVSTDCNDARVSTGNAGLDDILGGGLDADRMYLYEGRPGAGKTTLALEFLIDGARRGERVLYITLSETERELQLVARRHGWDLTGVEVVELVPSEAMLDQSQEITLLHPAELELGETTRLILEQVSALNPSRLVIDSLSELRLLAQSSLRYRRQVLALKQFFANRNCTVVLLDDMTSQQNDLQLHSISHGVVLLEQLAIDYGAERRRLRVIKMRGIEFRGGFHDIKIVRGGIEVYPRLVASDHQTEFSGHFTPSGNGELDKLLGGGLERGTNALLIGAAGVGKSSLALTYAITAAERGERSAIFAFDEGRGTIEARSRALGLDLASAIDSGMVVFQQIDPAEMSPGEFAAIVRRRVERDGARMVVIDSLNGYLNAMPDGRFLILQMHELLTYLAQQGVVTILVLAQHGMVGPVETPLDISYLSDAVLMLRYFEHAGRVRRALSVVKKRSGFHEQTIREFQLGRHGVVLGPPLTEFSGVLSGMPIYTGGSAPLLPGDDSGAN